jgi:kojibiose phosphorylase
VFEDAEAGIQAALDGNFWAVGIGPKERVGAAHAVISDFLELDWKTLIGKLDKKDM